MKLLYDIMEAILPFSWAEYDFMKNALLAVLIITPLFGVLGTMIVNNRMAFFSDALGAFGNHRNCDRYGIRNCQYQYLHADFCHYFCFIA